MRIIQLTLLTYTLFIFIALVVDAIADLLSEVRTKLKKMDIQTLTNILVIWRFVTGVLHELTHGIMICITFGRLKRMQVDVSDVDKTDINGVCVSKQRNYSKITNYIVDSLIGTAPLFTSTAILVTMYYTVMIPNLTDNNREDMGFYMLKLVLLMALLFDTSSDIDLGLIPNRIDYYITKVKGQTKEKIERPYMTYFSSLLYQKITLIKRLSIPAIIYSIIFSLISVLT